MSDATCTCPRCFSTVLLWPETRFCPRCGLDGVKEAAADTSPMDVTVGRRTFRVHERIAIGVVCAIYRCCFQSKHREVQAVFKIARDSLANDLVANEARILRRLHALDAGGRFTPFLPTVEETLAMDDGGSSLPRQANILRMHEQIGSPVELYTLAEVRAHYTAGLDGRDVAWMWRRLLNVLGFIHAQGTVHGAVLPVHVLIEPREHKVVLIDWCCAADDAAAMRRPPRIISGEYLPWYKREMAGGEGLRPGLDIALGARCMIGLLGGDAVRGEFPPAVEPALQRHFSRLLGVGPDMPADAWKLLDDFDRLIEALWGPRKFRALTMPSRRKA